MQRDWPDICGGLALAAIGAAAAGWALLHFDTGTLREMGPGAFPLALGLSLAALGLIVAVPAITRRGEPPVVEPLTALAILASIVVFALVLRPLGLVASTAASVLIAAAPAPNRGWRWRAVLAAVVTLLTVLVFRAGLQMSLPLWPRGV